MCLTKYIKILLVVSLLWASPARLTGSDSNSFNFDIDKDGTTNALTDGLLVIRYLFGFQEASLIENAVSAHATRFTATEIKDYLDANNSFLDVDGDGQADPLTDGLLVLRYLFGFSGESLILASLSVDAERTTSGEIESYVYTYLDSDGDGVTNPNDAFPLNPQETVDSDGDGVGNNADSFPTNPGESVDTDGDGIGDNGDEFPLNELEWMDSDGDGVGNNADAFPANVWEWEDSDTDGIGDNSDLFPNNAFESADYDADGVGDNSDAFPFDASEVLDTDADGIGNNADLDDDGDGVADDLDIAPGNASISKALAVNLDQVASIGLGNGLEAPAGPQGVGAGSLTKQLMTGLSEFFEFDKNRHLFGKVLQSDNVTNLLGFDEAGSTLEGILSSDKTTFVAEANVSPDRKYLYLLTSAHIQARTPGLLDKEDCSVYRIKISDGSFICLLLTDVGDIEPATLSSSLSNDHSRRAMDFRADGAAVMVGFDWTRNLPEGVSGGTNNTMAWILDAAGTLSSIPIQGSYYVSSTAWLDDDSIYVFQSPFGCCEEPSRMVIHNADTLEVEKIILHGYDEVTWEPEYFSVSQLTKYGGDLYDGAYVLDPETRTLAKSDALFGGVAVTNHTGEKQFDFDFTPHMPDLDAEVNAVWGACEYQNDYRRTLAEVSSAADKIKPMILNDCGIGLHSYSTYRQAETTDVKYRPFFFTDDYILYRRVFRSKSRIVSIEGNAYDYQSLLESGESFSQELSGDKGTLSVDFHNVSSAPSNWRYEPSDSVLSAAAQSVADGESGTGVTVSFEVETDGTTQSVNWLIPNELIDFVMTTGGEGHVQYVTPFTHREGFCIYEIATSNIRCSELDGYDVRVADAGNFNNPIIKEANRNAGVQTQLIVGPNVLVYFKDSALDQYFAAVANVEEFLRDGDSALTITESEEDDGAIKLIEQALALSMDTFRYSADVSVQRIADAGGYVNLLLDLGQGLSQRVALPEAFLVDAANDAETSIEKLVWDSNLQTVVLKIDKSDLATTTYRIQFREGYFYRNDSLRYQIPSSVEFIYDPDDFDADGSADDVDQDDDNDGTNDTSDAFPLDPLETLDTDSDGVGNNADTDDDNDGWSDEDDAFPLDDTESLDSDGDGIGNNTDADPYVADVYVVEFATGNTVTWENDELARIPVHRIYDIGGAISVSYTTSNINALAERDYIATSGSLTWTDGEKSVKYIEVPIIDNAETGDGTYQQFSVELTDLSGGNAYLGKSTTLVTIVDDDFVDIPENFIGVVTPMYFDTRVVEDAGSIALNFTRHLGSYGELRVQLSVDSVSNILNVGFDPNELPMLETDTLVWADGETGVKSITLTIPDDNSSEWTKSFRVSAPAEFNMRDSMGFVLDNELNRSQGSLIPLDHYVRTVESTKRLEFGVMRMGGREGERTISVATKSGVFGSREVEEGADYVAASETMSWRDGELGSKSMVITLVDDHIDEGESEWLALLVDGGYTVANSDPQIKPDTYLGLIFDDDPSTTDSDADGYIDAVDIDDDNDGIADPYDRFPYDPTESKDSDSDGIGDNTDVFPTISIDGRADTDSDGAPDSCPETCLSTGMTADEDDDNDGVLDENDAFPLDSSESIDTDGDGIGDNADSETLITSPAGVIEFAVDQTVVFEHESSVRIPLHRLYDVTSDASVKYSTVDLNATAGQDYEAISGTLAWQAGDKPSQKKYIEVPILDNDNQGNGVYRQFVIELSEIDGTGFIGKAKTLVTIVDDEFADIPDDFVGLLNPVYYGIRVEEGSGSIPFAFARRLGSAGEMSVNLNVYPKSGFLSEVMNDEELPTISVSTGVSLVAKGSTWLYLDDGSDQGAAWFASDFDDATWASGLAQLGYGDGDETTTISSGPSDDKNITTYFRRQFNVDDLPSIEKLTINLLRDDGAVVYLNGIEVVRSNMPSGAIGFNTAAAPQSIDGTEEDKFWAFNVEPSHLATGSNVLAVEIHQVSGSSADISFDLELIANEGDASLTWEDGESGVKYFTLNVPDDLEPEGIEMFDVRATFGDFSTVNTGHVLDNDLTDYGVLLPLHGYVWGSEQSQGLEFGVMRVGGGREAHSIHVETKTGIFNPSSEAMPADDYETRSETLSWADGEIGVKSVTIPIVDDVIAEAIENIAIMIDGGFESPSSDSQLKPDTYLGLVFDNDASTADFDEDGYVDAIDADDDNDGVIDSYDAFAQNSSETKDSDGDGIGDNEDDDDDGDGVSDQSDAYPLDPDKT
ncbi:MAG: hypothetical protein HOI43_14860 [Gammaproteobacteria bacterium]|nr:hypothetical protein [Gammaproteobacteria bacterium]